MLAADRTTGAPPAIAAAGLGLTYRTAGGEVVALTGVDLVIEPGAFVALIGPSGCGKTTLLRLVADLETPTAGSLLVEGLPPREARLARRYGYVFQAPALYPWRTVEANLTLPLEIMGVPKAERSERARRYLKLVDLEGFARNYPWQLSGGMQQRVSIARALSFDPDILLMDEPFGALDEITRDRLNLELHALWRKTNKTILFVTHSIAEAVYLATRIVVMSPRPGRILEVIESPLPAERPLELRDTPAFLEVAHRVREGLRIGHSYD
ncbi:MAG: ABC transporter ATP-binding protein [Geminicoccaceae bacterium]|nr:ABC transporter ATP-binding protein [Geminicoccaceae bacterium]MDW8370023.1 ABC transporter ATP-binding protein [Geminicoccaceae bacterium]